MGFFFEIFVSKWSIEKKAYLKLKKRQRNRQSFLTIGDHGLAEWWSDRKDNSHQQVLKAGEQEQGRVLETLNVLFFTVVDRGCVPGLVPNDHEQCSLEERLDHDLAD